MRPNILAGMATVYGETERGIVGTVRTRVSTNKVCLIETNPALSFHGTYAVYSQSMSYMPEREPESYAPTAFSPPRLRKVLSSHCSRQCHKRYEGI